jgi:DNA polymerase I-like protein with 3'-5' exonuclease and polymerase domains
MKRVAVDIETDDLNATVIHCIAAQDLDSNQVYTFHGDNLITTFGEFIQDYDVIVMHNGVSFDAPVLNRLAFTDIKLKQIRDTMIMSQLDDPSRDGGHSLESWGERLGFPKMDYQDFSSFNEEMLKYCINDVKLTAKLYRHLVPTMKRFSASSIRLEHTVRAIVDRQEKNGFTLDLPSASCLVARLSDESGAIEKEMQEIFPPIVEERYSEKTGNRLKDKVTVFNPGSRQQIASRLMDKGWKPKNFTPTGHPIVDEGTLNKVDIPEAQKIAQYLLLQKRVSQIKSWIDVVEDDGRVHGKVMTLKAISGRMAHYSPNMAQIPAVYSPYGKECRSVWITTNENYKLVGCDASSLELRCLAHYMNDPDFTKEVVNGDIHTANQKMAGLDTRDQAKTFIYALIYGAGPEKIGSIVGGGAKEGKRIMDRFMKNMPALKFLRENVAKASASGYIRGLDGRLLKVRQQHAAVNLLLQGAGAIICKEWLRQITLAVRQGAYDYRLVASIHDEYQFEVRADQAERFGEATKRAMKYVEENLKVRCPLDSEYKIGNNWAETH